MLLRRWRRNNDRRLRSDDFEGVRSAAAATGRAVQSFDCCSAERTQARRARACAQCACAQHVALIGACGRASSKRPRDPVSQSTSRKTSPYPAPPSAPRPSSTSTGTWSPRHIHPKMQLAAARAALRAHPFGKFHARATHTCGCVTSPVTQ